MKTPVATVVVFVLLSVTVGRLKGIESREELQLVDQDGVCAANSCQDVHDTRFEEETTDVAYFEPLDDAFTSNKKDDYLHKQVDYIKTHEWLHFREQVKKSNKDAHKTYTRASNMIMHALDVDSTQRLPFDANTLERKEPTFHNYLSTYFTTIRRGKHGRRELVRRRTFEEKFALLSFYDPLRLKLSFDPPPLQDYDSHKLNSELFDQCHQLHDIRALVGSVSCDRDVEDACGRCDHMECSVRIPNCFITKYWKAQCKGSCFHCKPSGSSHCCQPLTTVLAIPDGCATASASLILRMNKTDDFGILREVPPEIPRYVSRSTSECDRNVISSKDGVPALKLPLCCHCNYV